MNLKSRSLAWQLGMSAYWFATSMKWFVMLLTLAFVVNDIVPGGEEGKLWGRVVLIGATWAMVGPGLFGYLSDRTRTRFGRWRPYLAIGCAGTVFALIVLSNAREYWVVVVGYLLLQMSDDFATGPYSMLIPGLVPEHQRGRASGVMALMQFSAHLAGAAVSLALGDIRPIYLTVATMSVVCALITLFTVREDPAERISDRVGFAEGWIQPWKDHDFRWAWIVRFLNALGFYLILTYLGLYFAHVVRDFTAFGIPIAKVGEGVTPEGAAKEAVLKVAVIIAVLAAIGGVAGGRLADKIGRKRVVAACGWLMFAVLVPFALIPDFSVIVCLALLFGFGYGAYESSNWALVSDVMPSRENLAKDMGIWQSSIPAPQVIAGSLGFVVDTKNMQGTSGYTIVFLVAAAAYLFSTLSVRQIRGST